MLVCLHACMLVCWCLCAGVLVSAVHTARIRPDIVLNHERAAGVSRHNHAVCNVVQLATEPARLHMMTNVSN